MKKANDRSAASVQSPGFQIFTPSQAFVTVPKGHNTSGGQMHHSEKLSDISCVCLGRNGLATREELDQFPKGLVR